SLPKNSSGGMPRISVMDITLFSASGLKSRVEDLQPVNDPFIVDNIFKSPKKRRRGLLSWSAMPVAEVSAYAERQGLTTPLWDFPRHMRARNRRRSILGSKCSLSSMRRRRVRPSTSGGSCGGGEHSRSISDPTLAIIGVSPATVSSARGSESNSSTLPPTPHHDDDNNADEQSPRLSSAKSTASSISIKPRKHRRLLSFPKLSEVDTPPAVYRRSNPFFDQPPPPPPCALQSRAQPYISVSALRLVSDPCCGVREPAPVLLRPESLQRPIRCSSMPCVAPSAVPIIPLPPVLLQPAFVQWPLREKGSETLTKKFAGVKNSLDIRQPAPPLSATSQTRPMEHMVSPAKQKRDSGEQWAFTLLRRLAACGSDVRRR
ncbi:hypothetical protein IWW38_003076, partial [Coemansia aciculifera]